MCLCTSIVDYSQKTRSNDIDLEERWSCSSTQASFLSVGDHYTVRVSNFNLGQYRNKQHCYPRAARSNHLTVNEQASVASSARPIEGTPKPFWLRRKKRDDHCRAMREHPRRPHDTLPHCVHRCLNEGTNTPGEASTRSNDEDSDQR